MQPNSEQKNDAVLAITNIDNAQDMSDVFDAARERLVYLRAVQNHEVRRSFKVGQIVAFEGRRGQTVVGTIMKNGPSRSHIATLPREGQLGSVNWAVAFSLLHPASETEIAAAKKADPFAFMAQRRRRSLADSL